MFTPPRYREKAAEYGKRAKTANGADARRDLQERQHSLTVLAGNAQWLAENRGKTVAAAPVGHEDATPARRERVALAPEEERILRFLGAALLLQWNTLPRKLQKELFDSAGAMGELLETAELRGEIARFLSRHKDDEPHGPQPHETHGPGRA